MDREGNGLIRVGPFRPPSAGSGPFRWKHALWASRHQGLFRCVWIWLRISRIRLSVKKCDC